LYQRSDRPLSDPPKGSLAFVPAILFALLFASSCRTDAPAGRTVEQRIATLSDVRSARFQELVRWRSASAQDAAVLERLAREATATVGALDSELDRLYGMKPGRSYFYREEDRVLSLVTIDADGTRREDPLRTFATEEEAAPFVRILAEKRDSAGRAGTYSAAAESKRRAEADASALLLKEFGIKPSSQYRYDASQRALYEVFTPEQWAVRERDAERKAKADRSAAVAREQARRKAAEDARRAAAEKEKAERKAAEDARRAAAEKEKAEKRAAEDARRAAAEKEKAERKAAEDARRAAAEKEKAEKRAAEDARRAAAEKEKAERAKSEKEARLARDREEADVRARQARAAFDAAKSVAEAARRKAAAAEEELVRARAAMALADRDEEAAEKAFDAAGKARRKAEREAERAAETASKRSSELSRAMKRNDQILLYSARAALVDANRAKAASDSELSRASASESVARARLAKSRADAKAASATLSAAERACDAATKDLRTAERALSAAAKAVPPASR